MASSQLPYQATQLLHRNIALQRSTPCPIRGPPLRTITTIHHTHFCIISPSTHQALRIEVKEMELAHGDFIKSLKQQQDRSITSLRQEFERKASEIQKNYEKKMEKARNRLEER
jgi:hypothetical protein